jgi:hypothetical protein
MCNTSIESSRIAGSEDEAEVDVDDEEEEEEEEAEDGCLLHRSSW